MKPKPINVWFLLHPSDEGHPRKSCLTLAEAKRWIAGTTEPHLWTIWKLIPYTPRRSK